MMLLVDIGNTRVKWAQLQAGGLAPQRAADHAGWGVDDWEREVFGPDRDISRVAAVSVAGADCGRALVAAAARRGVADVRFIGPTRQACGVTNAYRDPSLLGADRWAAVIGAYHLLGGRACCVVDVGTAATIDVVDADGRHLGGFIVPGPRLMTASLLQGTSDLAARAAASAADARATFADNTRDAIERGCRVTIAALVDRSCSELARTAVANPALLITGGAAGEVMPYLVTPAELVPDLVLRGIARLAGDA